MFDAKKLLEQFLGSHLPGVADQVSQRAGQLGDMARNNPLKTAGLAAAILGTKTGRKLAGNVATVGGIAAVASLGYLAYKNYQSDQPATATAYLPAAIPLPPPQSPFSPQSAQLSNDFVLVLLRAIIAAAKADGHIDDNERANIMAKVTAADLGSEAQAFLEQELSNPVNIDDLVAAAKTQEQKVELYTATRMTIEPDTRAERGYLDLLSRRLGLPTELIDHIDATVSSARN